MRCIPVAIALPTLLLLAASAPALSQPQNHAVQLRVGGFLPSGDGELWTDNQALFDLDASDFANLTWGISFATGLSNNVELGINVDAFRTDVSSAYRDEVDVDGFAIEHDSRLRKIPLTVDLRLLPVGRYRKLSGDRQALRPIFYLGGGGGVNLWEYEEVGDFIDFTSDEIFFESYRDRGATWELHAVTGLELPLNPGFTVMLEGRYSWSTATLGGELAGLGDIDLGGASFYVGGSFRF